MKAPPRLLDDQSLPENLRQPLSAAAEMASGYDVAQGLERLEMSLAALDIESPADLMDGNDPGLADATLSVASASWGPLTKLTLATLAGLSVIAVWFDVVGGPVPVAPPRTPPTEQRPPQPAPSLAQVTEPSEPAAERLAADPAPALHSKKTAPEHSARAVPGRTEAEQLLRARELLRTDAKAALAILQRLSREYPRGVLREEREGLTVLALWQSGESLRARSLAQRFLASYPSSALRERIRSLLNQPAEQRIAE